MLTAELCLVPAIAAYSVEQTRYGRPEIANIYQALVLSTAFMYMQGIPCCIAQAADTKKTSETIVDLYLESLLGQLKVWP